MDYAIESLVAADKTSAVLESVELSPDEREVVRAALSRTCVKSGGATRPVFFNSQL